MGMFVDSGPVVSLPTTATTIATAMVPDHGRGARAVPASG